MNNTLKNKVALVTGASRGVGKSIAISLAGAGARVVLAARDIEALAQVSDAVKEAGGDSLLIPSEITNEGSIKNLVEGVQGECGALDILVNNAGVTFAGSLAETATEDWDHCMNVNARGAFILCREALPLLRQAQQGYIINISSVVGIKGYANQIAYTASKHALRGMSIALAEELKGQNIRVHVICPGGIDTEMISRVRPDINKDELIQPEEIADLVLYLVTHKGNAVVDEIRLRRATASPWF